LISVRTKKEFPYLTTVDRDLRQKQYNFPKHTQEIYIQKEEVKTYDNYTLVQPLIDPNERPHELHLIKKIGKLIGEPKWVKTAMIKLGFHIRMNKEWKIIYSIKPNIKEINDLLWLCKHIVKITPIKFKNGYPSKDDLGNTKLNLETGEFEIIKKINIMSTDSKLSYFNLNDVNLSTDLRPNHTFPLGRNDYLKNLHREKQLCKLNDEYFPAVYDYKYDQDKHGVIKPKGIADTSIKEDELKDSNM
jgi:hypothetical protein